MKHNFIKKVGALALAAVMTMGMSATVFAADESGQAGVIGEFETPNTAIVQSDTVVIYKEITAYNPESVTVNAPAITFNYTIGSDASLAGKDIYDASSRHNPAANAHAVTKQGVGTPTITGTSAGVITLVPGTEDHQLNASVNGTANRFPLTVDFSSIDWNTDGTGAGVYRYVITETTSIATKNASGIKDGNNAANDFLYMDVYVNGNNEIYGYALFTNNDSIDARENNEASAATAAGKTEGFVGNQPDDGTYASEVASTADKYYTYNLSVQKNVTNDNYTVTTKHQFPFELTLTNQTVTANVLPIVTLNDSTLATESLTAAPIAGTWDATIASGGIVTYTGIPTGTTVVIKEQNDVIGVMYSSSSENADTNADRKDINTIEWSNTATVNCNASALTIATKNHTDADKGIVIFTNNLLQISPTGVALRFAPYALMLAGGIVLLMFLRRRREDNHADMI